MSERQTLWGVYDPRQWQMIVERAKHPADGQRGALLTHRQTGAYCLMCAGVYRSVPRAWAQRRHMPVS